MKRLLATLVIALFAVSAWALPTLADVQAEVRKGDFAQAETMMKEVVAAKPGSARAHYLYAEILAHNRHFEQAVAEAKRAKAIDPSLKFTQPEKFRAFEHLLEQEQAAAKKSAQARQNTPDRSAAPTPTVATPAAERQSGIPGWMWGLGGAGIALLLWRMIRARRRDRAPSMATFSPGMAAGPHYHGMGQGYPGAPVGGGGSGLLGTGLAAAGGFAAGMLADRLNDDHSDHGSKAGSGADAERPASGLDDRQAHDFAARDLEQRDIDFGAGDDWGGDAGGGGDDW